MCQNYEYRLKFLQVIEDQTGDSFLRHDVDGRNISLDPDATVVMTVH